MIAPDAPLAEVKAAVADLIAHSLAEREGIFR